MKLSDISIRRPVLATMMSTALVLFGVIAFTRLPVREFPDVDVPVISVTVSLPGANARVMETTVTEVIEEELATIQGIRTLSSTSTEQFSSITIEFTLERDLEAAAQDVRDKVAGVRGRLPEDVLDPVVTKQDSDAQPFIWIALAGANYSLIQLSDIAERLLKTPLQSLSGVGRVMIFGERRYSMRVWLRASALAARGLTVQDVERALLTRNVELPAGRIESQRREFTVRSLGELKTPAEFEEIVISSEGGRIVRLSDVARIELGAENYRTAIRYKGNPTVGVGVVRQSKSNLIHISDEVHAELGRIEATLPPGVEMTVAVDQSDFVRRSIREAEDTLLLAAILVVLIIFVFLRNLRATIIPGLAIPTSIISAFAVMYFLGFTINNLTLLALILAIGIVVDDAIIVLENAYRHQDELGKDPTTAALHGTREISFAVIATTVALVAVFAPLAFLQGTTGRLFNEFGIAMAGAVVVSSFVALSLTPMLCAKILRVKRRHGVVYNMLERGFQMLAAGYAAALGFAIRHRWAVVGVAAISIGGAFIVFGQLEREFIPPEDRDVFFVITIAPEGSTLEYTDGYQLQAEAMIARLPEVEGYFSIVNFSYGSSAGSPSSGMIYVRLKKERERSVDEVLSEIRPQLFMIPGIFAFASSPPALGWGNPLNFVVRNPDFDSLTVGMDAFVARARQIPGLLNVDTNLKVNKPELSVSYDRDRMEDLGVAVSDVSSTLQTMLGGRRVGTFTRDNKQYYVRVRLEPDERATPGDLHDLYVRGRDGGLVQLDAVARVEEGVGPRGLNHFNRVRSFTLTGGLAEGFTLGQAIDSLNAAAAEVLPRGSDTALAGESRELNDSGNALYFAFVLAVLIVFMVLAAQFESLVHPFTVLLAVPLAVTGALVALLVAGSTLNIYSQIGMILLIGLVTKNSILLVEYANQLRSRGLDIVPSMIEAGRIRLRPILMTAVATIAGALPIALGLGAGSMSRRPLGYAIVGGLLFSTLLTLFLVPVVWVYFENARERLSARAAVRAAARATPESAIPERAHAMGTVDALGGGELS